jgi:hypothetical protein
MMGDDVCLARFLGTVLEFAWKYLSNAIKKSIQVSRSRRLGVEGTSYC